MTTGVSMVIAGPIENRRPDVNGPAVPPAWARARQ
jgi:hypothetical protein